MPYPTIEQVDKEIEEKNTPKVKIWFPDLTYPGIDSLPLSDKNYQTARDLQIHVSFKIWNYLWDRNPDYGDTLFRDKYPTYEDYLEILYLQSTNLIKNTSRRILEPRGLCEILERDTLAGLLLPNIIEEK